jgi:hypothetical protein
MADAQPRTSCRSLFKQLVSLFHAIINFHKWTSFSILRNFFKPICLYTILIRRKSNIFIDQRPAYLVFKKVSSILE